MIKKFQELGYEVKHRKRLAHLWGKLSGSEIVDKRIQSRYGTLEAKKGHYLSKGELVGGMKAVKISINSGASG